MAVVIVLLYCLKAEIYQIHTYVLPVYGRQSTPEILVTGEKEICEF